MFTLNLLKHFGHSSMSKLHGASCLSTLSLRCRNLLVIGLQNIQSEERCLVGPVVLVKLEDIPSAKAITLGEEFCLQIPGGQYITNVCIYVYLLDGCWRQDLWFVWWLSRVFEDITQTYLALENMSWALWATVSPEHPHVLRFEGPAKVVPFDSQSGKDHAGTSHCFTKGHNHLSICWLTWQGTIPSPWVLTLSRQWSINGDFLCYAF